MAQARLSVRKIRAAWVGAVDRTLECERAGTSMLFGNLGAPPKLGPRFLRCPARNHLRGALKVESGQSPVRLVWAESGQKQSPAAALVFPHSGLSVQTDPIKRMRRISAKPTSASRSNSVTAPPPPEPLDEDAAAVTVTLTVATLDRAP